MNQLKQLVERDQWAELLIDAQDIYKQSANSEIEILAFSEKEVLKKAIEVFNVPKEYLKMVLIKQGAASFFGIIKSPSSYIVSVKEEFRHLYNSKTGYDTYNELAQHKDGSFRLIMKKKGLVLEVYPPIGLGKVVLPDEIILALQERNCNIPDPRLIEKAITKNVPVVVAPCISNSDNNSTIQISIAKDLMEASMVFTKPIENGRIPEVEEIVENLKNMGVAFGIKEQYIQEALNNELYNIPIIVAEGQKAKNGTNAYIEYKFPTGEETFKHAVRSDGSVDFKELNIIHNVFQNDVLAIMHPATVGREGCNIKGETFPANDGQPIEWNIGSNVFLSEDKLKVLAENSGQVYLNKGKQICVDTALEIPSDVDLSVGNIDFLGNVIIKGSIKDGFSVISGGNIEVYGHIGNCFMHAEGDIIARQGVQGKDQAQIECKGNLFAHFIERAQINTGGNLIVTKSLLHSKVICDKGVYVIGGKKSIIAGGDIKALSEITTQQLGAESYIETKVEVGYSQSILDAMSSIKKTISNLEKQLEEFETKLSMQIPGSEQAAKTTENILYLEQQLERNNQLLEHKQEELHSLRNKATISVSKSFLPGVKIKIGTNTLDIIAPQPSGTLKMNKNKDMILDVYTQSQLMQELTNNQNKK